MLVFVSGQHQSCSELPAVQSFPTEAWKVTLHSWSYSWNHQDTGWAVKGPEAEVTCLNTQAELNSILGLWDSEHSVVCCPWELGCELKSKANPKSLCQSLHLPAGAPGLSSASHLPHREKTCHDLVFSSFYCWRRCYLGFTQILGKIPAAWI